MYYRAAFLFLILKYITKSVRLSTSDVPLATNPIKALA